ncbi:Molybdopterin or thiamine biosynthesis adenylyltransferase [Dyella jiangningensis]|uniref:molybdopterin-synthase adenylyltransferase MoeB n=1 Tax=Dyella sp. AtDHG13 TaxID=1938897 RepID=UPI00088AC981|nr:molybdopterin-synthase adenylyltransferase MoeB [Dyella sp. AtDHG13]PXV60401.1 molybdopterin/thiamine biosynthesis adenylyltransferase [Dyella sp. AtDHG13]SDJ44033.1 Molybdopterin or thiamine biosynthesis adenylyltransferase [Dyella jiangningensis]
MTSLDRDRWLASLRASIPEISPVDALARQAQGNLLIDVREDGERAGGTPVGAVGLSRGFLELRIEQIEADRRRPILVLCGSGQRSLLAAEALQRMGYEQVASVAGGYQRWKAEGLPVAASALDSDAAERYARQLQLPQVGEAGQAKLGAASIALLGAGGLGAPAALYLAAAGVGQITLIDDDRVERSNLHRQVIHADARVGMYKTESARIALAALNPRVRIEIRNERLRADNVERLLAGHDLVIDGADNFPARYLVAAASRRLRLPMVYGAVERFTGQVSVFDPRRADSPCYRCLFPEPPAAADAPNCSEAGVLGVLPGIVGLLQATEALKLILAMGEPLVGRLLTFDALGMRFRETRLPRDPGCPGCGDHAVFQGYEDLVQLCASAG